MKVYSRKRHRNIERKVHFGVGKSVKTACGLILFSRHVMVGVFSDSDGALITDDINRVTCKRCLNLRESRLRKLIEVEHINPGIFDHDTLCGEEWLLDHGLSVSKDTIGLQKLELIGKTTITLSNNIPPKERKKILSAVLSRR